MGRQVSLSGIRENLLSFWKKHGIISLILLCSLLLYAYQLTAVPNGLYNDEASIAVNARQIASESQDEHGFFLPLYFQAFGEYKNPLYIYSAAALFSILGPSDFALRLTSVFFAMISILLIYLIGLRIFHSKTIGLMAAVLLSVTPWHFEISRVGFEVASSNCILLAALYFLFRYRENVKKLSGLFLGTLFLGLYLYSYTTARLLSPLLFLLILILYMPVLWKNKRHLAGFILFYAVLVLPFVWFYLTQPDFNAHFTAISIFSNANPIGLFFQNVAAYFSPAFLFQIGDANIRHHAAGSGVGELYWVILPLTLIGLVALFRKYPKYLAILVLMELLLFPLPGSLTTEGVPHALRAYHAVPWIILASAIGVQALLNWSNKLLSRTVLSVLFISFMWQSAVFFHTYFVTYPAAAYTPKTWQKEEQEINAVLRTMGDAYDVIYESSSYRNQVAIFHTWYLNPALEGKIMPLNSSFKYRDRSKKTLVILPAYQVSSLSDTSYTEVHTIRDGNGKALFVFLALP